jgi:hypothetical protein
MNEMYSCLGPIILGVVAYRTIQGGCLSVVKFHRSASIQQILNDAPVHTIGVPSVGQRQYPATP